MVLGKSLNQFFKLNNIDGAKKILAYFPVNLRPMPTSYKDLYLDNCFSTSNVELPLNESISTIHETISPFITTLVTNEFLYASYYFLQLISYFPKKFACIMIDSIVAKLNASISNIPFSDVPWKINGKEIKTVTFNSSIV